MIYQNYHCHKDYTNPRISDSAARIRDYAERAAALGHGILSSVEHGWQGNYYECWKTAKKYDLKLLIGAEAYWVKDRTEKDSTNAHIWQKSLGLEKTLCVALWQIIKSSIYR